MTRLNIPYARFLAEIARGRAFWLGLILRLMAMACLLPQPQADWFLPFLNGALNTPSLDIWAAGAAGSFPYGLGMFLFLCPFLLVGHLAGGLIGADLLAPSLKAALLAADFLALAALWALAPEAGRRRLPAHYWLCPAILIATWWTGQLDIVPISLFMVSLWLLRKMHFRFSALFLAMSVSAKFSLALFVPFSLGYLFFNARFRAWRRGYAASLALSSLALLGLPLLSIAYRRTVMGTPELHRLFDLSLPIGQGASLYLTPLLLLMAVHSAWQVRHLNFRLLMAFMGVSALILVMATETPPGWYMWPMPFLVLHLVSTSGGQRALGWGFVGLVACHQFLFWPMPSFLGAALPFGPLPRQSLFFGLWHTATAGLGLLLAGGMLGSAFYGNRLLGLGHRPVSIGIAGDSGVGKDRLASSLAGLFGEDRVARLSGDDYHLWDRRGAAWKALTHLNPRGNDLRSLFADANRLLDGKGVIGRHYDHARGAFSAPRVTESRDVCIVSGLHALMQPAIRSRLDLKVFLGMEVGLREFFKLRRDSDERGYARKEVEAALAARATDSKKYVEPQAENADMVLTLGAYDLGEENFVTLAEPRHLYLVMRLRHALYCESLLRRLVSLCGLQVEMGFQGGLDAVTMRVEGDARAEDIAMAAGESLAGLMEFLAVEPRWLPGLDGVVQLTVLNHLMQSLRSKRQ